MKRNRLPNRRPVETFNLTFEGQTYIISVGDCEVFANNNKISSPLDYTIADAAKIYSVARQYGVPMEVLCKTVARNPDGSPASIIGAVLDAINDA